MKAHLVDCTYCAHRWVTPGNKKKKTPEIERCALTLRQIPSPRSPGRSCEQFHQQGHDCKTCWSA